MEAFWGKLKEKLNKKTEIGLGLWLVICGWGLRSTINMGAFVLLGPTAVNAQKEHTELHS